MSDEDEITKRDVKLQKENESYKQQYQGIVDLSIKYENLNER